MVPPPVALLNLEQLMEPHSCIHHPKFHQTYCTSFFNSLEY